MTFGFRAASALATLGLLFPRALAGQHFPADEDLQLMLRYIVEDAAVPGLVLGVLDPDGSSRIVSWGTGGAGMAAVSDRSVFQIGSVTKTFTATVLADMVARGEVALDDPVSLYLPARVEVPSAGGEAITLEDLATHTSGLPMWGRNPAISEPAEALDDYDVEAMYAFLAGVELEREPGAAYRYSNLGYGLLAHALSRAAGMPWPELLRKRVLEPLGLEATGYRPPQEEARRTEGHEPGDVVSVDTEARWGAGGLRSDARDMLAYLRAYLDPPEGSLGEAMRLAHRPRVSGGEGGSDVGLGWQIMRMGDRSVAWHGGRSAGYMAWIGLDAERRVGTVLLTNTEAFPDADLTTALLLMSPAPQDWRADADTTALREYAGEYRGSSGPSFYVRREAEGWLTYQASGNARTRLYPRSDSTFYMLRGPWTLTFRRDESGDVVGMAMAIDEREPVQQGAELAASRVSSEMPPPGVVAAGGPSRAGFPWSRALTFAAAGVALAGIAGVVIRRRNA